MLKIHITIKIWIFSLLIFACQSAWSEDIVVIANKNVPVDSLSIDDLSDIYLLKTYSWDDGEKIIPINRELGSSARNKFLNRVLNKPQSALSAYWEKMHYKGLTPPLVEESDKAVLAFVQNIPGAIGYISSSFLTKNVKVLAKVK